MAYRVDYGPRWFEGIIDLQPPKLGKKFPSLVAQVDSLGNEVGGVPAVELLAPIATYTPWNLRAGYPGRDRELVDFRGTYIPLPRTKEERKQNGDPRPSIESLYSGRQDYLSRVEEAAQTLVTRGFLLEEDVDAVVERARRYWDWIIAL